MSGKHKLHVGGSGNSGHQRSRAPTEGTIVSGIRGIQDKYRPDMKLHHDDNHGGTLPVGGAGPSESNLRHEIKQELLRDPQKFGFQSLTANVDVGDSEISLIRSRQDQLQQAGFFQWLSTVVDVRDPGMLSWLNDMVPEYAEAQLAQLKSNQELRATAAMIKNFGVQSREDLMFQYMIDTGQIRDTREYKPDLYIPGWFAPRGSIYDASGDKATAKVYSKANLGAFADQPPRPPAPGYWFVADKAGSSFPAPAPGNPWSSPTANISAQLPPAA